MRRIAGLIVAAGLTAFTAVPDAQAHWWSWRYVGWGEPGWGYPETYGGRYKYAINSAVLPVSVGAIGAFYPAPPGYGVPIVLHRRVVRRAYR